MSDNYGPPDLPQRQFTPPKMAGFPELPNLPFSPKLLLVLPAVLLILIAVWGSFYTVETEEVGVVLRFGKYSRTTEPGLRFKLPFGIEKVARVPVRRQLKQEFGFGTDGATNLWQKTTPDEWQSEKEMVTGDLNAALVEWVVQYRISEPRQYLFNVRDPDETLRHVSESVMREAVGDRTVDEVLTVGRQDIEREALEKLQELTNKYEMGLRIDQVQLKDVNPPRPVQASFNEVNQAQQQREQSINIASGQFNREVPQARGEAQRTISDAEGYATQRVNEAEGDAARFNAIYLEYSKAPAVTRQRLYLETMTEVVPKLGRKIIIDDEAKQILPLLNLNPANPMSLLQNKGPLGCLGAIIIAVVLFTLFGSVYTIDETQQAIVTQFGKPVGEPVTTAGLKFKAPFVQDVNIIEKRILAWDGTPNEMPTKDKTYIIVDTFGRWRIAEPLQYFERLRDERSAISRLNDILGSETRNTIANNELIEVVRTTQNRDVVVPEDIAEADLTGNVGVLEVDPRWSQCDGATNPREGRAKAKGVWD